MVASPLELARPAAANDNPSRGADKWRYLIDRFTAIDPSLGVLAAQHKLRGLTAEQFCHAFLLAARSAGWSQAKDYV